jgi:F0F1-type ATP synthase delta subunit
VELKLSLSVIGQVDIIRLLRELNALNDFFVSVAARKAGSPMTPPRITRILDEVAKINELNLLEKEQRTILETKLKALLTTAPLLHISFASEPSPKALERILSWLRQNIDVHTLLQVGLQPTIAAGCVLRTPNKLIDMSMRNYLKMQEPYLVQLIQGATSEHRS